METDSMRAGTGRAGKAAGKEGFTESRESLSECVSSTPRRIRVPSVNAARVRMSLKGGCCCCIVEKVVEPSGVHENTAAPCCSIDH